MVSIRWPRPKVALTVLVPTLAVLALILPHSGPGGTRPHSQTTTAPSTDSDWSLGEAQRQALSFFKQQGLTTQQSAAIVGNLMQESGLNPAASHPTGSLGVAQWTNSYDHTQIRISSAPPARTLRDLAHQLSYLWSDFTTDPQRRYQNGYAEFLAAPSLEEATRIFAHRYLKPAVSYLDRRIEFARALLPPPSRCGSRTAVICGSFT